MRKDDDRRGGALALEIIGEPGELLVAEIAHAAGLEVDHVDETDEVHAALIERVPAGAARAFAVALQVGLAGPLVDHIVLARHVVSIELQLGEGLSRIIEFLRLRQMRDIAGMNHEGGLDRHGRNFRDGLFERCQRIGIGGPIEADMAVRNL